MRPLLSPEAVNKGALITGIPLTWVDLLAALANPCYEVQRLLAMADDWRSD
jgi:hypothetical protein